MHAVAEAHEHAGGRQITVDARQTLPAVSGDLTYLEQILRNLLANAEKYSRRDTPITISVARRGRRMRFAVSDRGAGIPADELKRVFTPFFRSTANGHEAPGVGIGLAVCKRLVEAIGGRIRATPRPGGGTEFGFTLAVDRDWLQAGAAMGPS
ncbi:MAG: sensor histidine kinase [Dehalococcoidia bacterium]|nr:sensor histidine kinase [Dehalococcoidia bacterium]